MDIQFATQTYKHDTPEVSSERCVNAYAQFQPKSAKTPIAVFGSPGIVECADLGDGPVRGAHIMKEVPYFVSGNQFWSVDVNNTPTFLGSGISGLGPVVLDNNGTDIVITNGTAQGWYWNATDGLNLISDAQFLGANTVTFLDQRFVFDRRGTNEFFHSDILDGSSYPAANSGAAESSPDLVSAVRAHLQTLFVIGSRTIEPWKTTANVTFPFQIVDGATIQRGSFSPFAVVSEDNSLFFIGEDRIFYRMDGLQLVPLSTPAVAASWQRYTTVSDAHAFSYTFSGHKMIVISFPGANATWVYDLTTRLWHERESLLFSGQATLWRGSCSCSAFDKVYVGDRRSGRIGYLDSRTYTEFGDSFTTTLVSPPIHGGGRTVFMPCFELDIATGVGLPTGQGSMPTVMLDYSDDGGHNFVSYGEADVLDGIGGRYLQPRWNRLGSFDKSRFIRIRISDPVRRTVLGARCPGLYVGSR